METELRNGDETAWGNVATNCETPGDREGFWKHPRTAEAEAPPEVASSSWEMSAREGAPPPLFPVAPPASSAVVAHAPFSKAPASIVFGELVQ